MIIGKIKSLSITFLGNIFLIFLLYSCQIEPGFEFSQSFGEDGWDISKPVIFKTDSLVKSEDYLAESSIRFDDSYPYYNLFMNAQIMDSKNHLIAKKRLEFILFDPITGKKINKIGKSMGEGKVIISSQLSLKKGEKYHIKLEQIMRLDTLPGILSVNLSLHPKQKKNGYFR